MLRWLLNHSKIRILYKGYFVYEYLTKHICNYNIVKNRSFDVFDKIKIVGQNGH